MSEETKAPETKAPETKAPETKAPEVKATTEAKPAATETPAATTAPATTSRPASTDRPSRPERPRRPGGGGFKKRGFGRRKTCFFCDNKKVTLDYKDGKAFRPYITERGKILPRRTTGTCAKHQRFVSQAIKRARNIAVLPYSTISLNT